MPDKPKAPDSNGWDTALDGGPPVGVNREAIHKALEMNPEMRKKFKTTDVMRQLGGGKAAPDTAPKTSEESAKATGDVIADLTHLKEAFAAEKKAIASALAELQKRERELRPKMLEALNALLVAGDPNLTSPTTQELLKREQAFLNEVGFSASRLLDARLKTLKK